MGLDIRTVIAATALCMLVVSIAMCVAARSYPDRVRRGAVRWALASIVQAGAWVLIALRGTVADVLSIVAANALLVLALSMYYDAIKAFKRERLRAAAVYWPAPAVLLLFVYFGLVAPNYGVRVVVMCAVGAGQMFACAVALLRTPEGRAPGAHVFTASGFIVCGLVLVVRAVDGLAHASPETPASLFEPTVAQTIGFLLIFVAQFLLAFGFLLMCNETFTKELVRLAALDPLTEQYNRRTVEDLARREISRARREKLPVAIAILDLDDFKRINDTFGHAVGDVALQHVAAVMRTLVRVTDLTGRYGGEEFLVVMPNTTESQAANMAERVREGIETIRLESEGRPVRVTASVGVASLPGAEADFSTLFGQADRALYAAKAAGRNLVRAASTVGITA